MADAVTSRLDASDIQIATLMLHRKDYERILATMVDDTVGFHEDFTQRGSLSLGDHFTAAVGRSEAM